MGLSSLLMDDGVENVQVRCYDGSGRVLTTTQVKPTSAAEMAVGEGQQRHRQSPSLLPEMAVGESSTLTQTKLS